MSQNQARTPISHDTAPPLRRWLRVSAAVLAIAVATGSLCAFFLWSLAETTRLRFAHPWLLALLPAGGFLVGWIYHRFGKPVEKGTPLLIDEIHQPTAGVPIRLVPLVLFGTLATHLFGGSAGREGTAVQMGGGVAGAFCRWFRLAPADTPILLMAGIAAGFGGVFGTPFAGAVFSIEILAGRRRLLRALPFCLAAAIVADRTCAAWGIGHAHYAVHDHPLTPLLIVKIAAAAIAFGLASRFFVALSHALTAFFRRTIAYPPLRPVAGGLLVILLFLAAGTPDYLGLGVSSPDPHAVTLSSFFTSAAIHPWSWLWKIAFTSVTLSSGFKGGEVTPLFFIGAALGNSLSGLLAAPPDLFAALGLLAVFAAAARTPLACILMGIEIFGARHGLPFAGACLLACLFNGNAGIYHPRATAGNGNAPSA